VKQIILIYVRLSRLLIPHEIYLILARFERREKPQLFLEAKFDDIYNCLGGHLASLEKREGFYQADHWLRQPVC